MGFYDRDMQFVVEAGAIEVMIGSSSADTRLSGDFEITGANNDRFRVEGSGNTSYTFTEPTDEELSRFFSADECSDLLNDPLILEVGIVDQGHRMNPDVVGDYELRAR